jgi:hypothetical protein
MLNPDKIVEMERRLSERRLPVAELCRRAGIKPTTWWRWKNGAFAPSYRKGKQAQEAFDALMAEDGGAPLQGAA